MSEKPIRCCSVRSPAHGLRHGLSVLRSKGHLAKLKESQRRLSEQQQAVLYSNYSLLSLAAGRLDVTREIICTCKERCAATCLTLNHMAVLPRCSSLIWHCVPDRLSL